MRSLRPAWRWLRDDTSGAARAARSALAVLLFLVVVQFWFDLTIKYYINGIALGSLYGIIGVAIILIYRTNRIVNFAAAAVGAVPGIFALMLVIEKDWNYLVALPVAVVGGPIAGWMTDRIAMRRFAKSPRLITTVVSIGVAQSWAALGFFIPVWMGARAGAISLVPTPWKDWKLNNGRGEPIVNGDQVFAVVVVILAAIALALFLRYTRLGIALRASAENADRALLLGIPVNRVATIAWMIAGLLSALVIYVQSPLIGVPGDASLGFTTLLYGLAAAVVARMERIGVALAVGMGIGIVIFASVFRTGAGDFASALMLVVILGALLLQRKSIARALDAGTSTWETVKQFRPIPRELRGLREVELARVVLYVLAIVVAVGAPFVLHRADLSLLIVLPLFAMVAVSLVVLTGWAGQISLGQFGLVGAGAAVAGGLVAKHNIDFFYAVALGIGAGMLVAVLVGLPAIRIQGLYLAVTTLAFGYAMQYYFLNKTYWIGKHLLPTGFTADLRRPLLYGSIDLENERTFYFVCLIFLAAVVAAAIGFRRTRSGRVLIAARDNQRAAPAYAINIVRARLAAFAISGGIAGLAGVLFAYSQHNVIPQTYSVESSIVIFLAATIGGLTSVPFAVIGTVSFEAFVLFGPRFYQSLGQTFSDVVPLLLTGPLLVLNLYFYPGGSAEAGFATRDKFLRRVANKYHLLVPSLIADRRVEELDRTGEVVLEAEHHMEEAAAFDERASAAESGNKVGV